MSDVVDVFTVSYNDSDILNKMCLSLIHSTTNAFNIYVGYNGEKPELMLHSSRVNVVLINTGVHVSQLNLPSYRHTTALNALIKSYCTSKYVLVTDPDIFWYEGGFDEMLARLKGRDYGAIGTVWHPYHAYKYSNALSVHCTLFNRDVIHLDEIDWRPSKKDKRRNNLNALKSLLLFIINLNDGDTGSRNTKLLSGTKVILMKALVNREELELRLTRASVIEKILIKYKVRRFSVYTERFTKGVEYFSLGDRLVLAHLRRYIKKGEELERLQIW